MKVSQFRCVSGEKVKPIFFFLNSICCKQQPKCIVLHSPANKPPRYSAAAQRKQYKIQADSAPLGEREAPRKAAPLERLEEAEYYLL